jgi:dihydropteroate synthase
MLGLRDLARLAEQHGHLLDAPICEFRLRGEILDLESEPLLMGVVNLSRDSTYRDSVAVSCESAVRRGRIIAAQGARLVDVGAESTNASAAQVSDGDQIAALVPVVASLTAAGIAVSVEAASPQVVRACLEAGAAVVNLTGREYAAETFELVARFGAAVILCGLPGGTARDRGDAAAGADPLREIMADLHVQISLARAQGVENLLVDPGLGFYYSNLTDPRVRAKYQAEMLLQTFRMRELGVPICQSLPHAFDHFEEEFRSAVLALLGGVQVLRTHEVGQLAAILRAWQGLQRVP